MKQSLTLFIFVIIHCCLKAQNVGIGTTSPMARFHVADSSVLFFAPGETTIFPGNPPISGAGRRMMWYPDKGAFRTGYVSADQWDKNNVGYYSFASGYDVRANGGFSTAFGGSSVANGPYSTSMGYSSFASGFGSAALGFRSSTTAYGSISLGALNDDTDSPDPTNATASDRIFQIGNGDINTLSRSNAMTVLRNGNTGIGITTPQTTLHIKSSSNNPVIFDGSAEMWVTLAENGINRGYIGSYAGNVEDVDLGTYYGSSGSVHLTTGNTPRLTVINNGNVGIGLTSPSEKLEVTGNVKATSYIYSSPKTFYYSVHPSAFQAELPSDNIYRDFATVYYFNPPNGTYMVAPLNLPNGAIITGFTVYFVDNSATEDLRVVLLYHPHLSNGNTELARVVSSGTPGASSLSAPSIGAPAAVNNQLANYAIEANPHSDHPWPGLNLQIRSILITYTMNETQ